jgi:N-sulfoglucosamine sulfohydrolase
LVLRTREWPSEFYDLEADPGEKRNLIEDPGHRTQIAALRRDLEAFFRRLEAPPLEQWRATTAQQLPTYRLWSELRDAKR